MNNLEPLDNSSCIGTDNSSAENGENAHDNFNSNSIPAPSIQLLVYLIPIVGFFPSLWTLYRREGSREQLAVSRLSITLALTWLSGYLLLVSGAATSSEFFSLRLLILDTFVTSGYFLVSFWLIARTVKGKSNRLPTFSRFAEAVLGKYLS